jgi:hypothetical protein
VVDSNDQEPLGELVLDSLGDEVLFVEQEERRSVRHATSVFHRNGLSSNPGNIPTRVRGTPTDRSGAEAIGYERSEPL